MVDRRFQSSQLDSALDDIEKLGDKPVNQTDLTLAWIAALRGQGNVLDEC